MSMPPLLLAADANNRQSDVRSVLERSGIKFKPWSFQTATAPDPAGYRLLVVDSFGAMASATEFCRGRRAASENAAPILWLSGPAENRLAGWRAGADAVLPRPFEAEELTAQVDVLLRRAEERDGMRAAAAGSRPNQQWADQLKETLAVNSRIAREIRNAYRPKPLFQQGRTILSACRREHPGGGNVHNIMPIDSERFAFYLGDILDSGLTVSLLAILINQSFQGVRHCPAGEVLQRLNRRLAALELLDPPLIRLTYGTLDADNGVFSYACAGHTAPLFVPQTGAPSFCPVFGAMLGSGDATYPTEKIPLASGDRVVLFTDGLHGTHPETRSDLLEVVERHRELPLASSVEYVAQDLLAQTPEPSDFTMLGIEYR
jgi:serine phosphatase RsbU (regulator of sigma subunit)